MKISGYVIILVMTFFTSSNSKALTCASFFGGKFSEDSNSKLIESYLSIATELTKKSFSPENPSQSKEIASESKMNFVKKYGVAIENILSKGDVSLEDIVKARIFLAESVSGNISQPHSYIMLIKGKIYSFDLKQNSYKVLNVNKVGYNKESMVEFLRLSKTLIVLVLNETAHVYPIENKDPNYFKKLAEENKLAPAIQLLYPTFKNEFHDLLMHTTISIADFSSAAVEKLVATKTGETIYLLVVGGRNFYLTSKPGTVDQSNKKRWKELDSNPQIGYENVPKLELKLNDGTVLYIEDNVLKLSKEAKVYNLLFTLKSILENTETSQFRSVFIKKYGDIITDLIQKDNFIEPNFNMVISNLEIIITGRGHSFYTLTSKNGELYFDVATEKWGFIKDLSIAEFGKEFYTSNMQKIQIGRSIGFLSKVEAKRVEADNIELNKQAFLSKISIALGRSDLTVNQKEVLIDGSGRLMSMGLIGSRENIKSVSPQLLVETVAKFKADLINRGLFTMKEAEEIIKVIF